MKQDGWAHSPFECYEEKNLNPTGILSAGISKMFNLKHKCEALSRDITRKRPILTCYLLIGASACCGIDTSVEWSSDDRVWRFTPYNHYLDEITLSSVLAYFRFQVTVPVIFIMCE